MYEYPSRSIMAHTESSWEFSENGERLPFEDVDKYQRKRIRDRLTAEMIERYCGSLGIELFNPDFYMGESYIICRYPPPNAAFYPEYPNKN